MYPEEVRTRAKRGLIPSAKIGRRWVFIEEDLAKFVRSLYPVKRQAPQVKNSALEGADRSGGSSLQTMKEYSELLGLKSRRGRKS
jgi:hypothetical protein